VFEEKWSNSREELQRDERTSGGESLLTSRLSSRPFHVTLLAAYRCQFRFSQSSHVSLSSDPAGTGNSGRRRRHKTVHLREMMMQIGAVSSGSASDILLENYLQ
jgi:hypothetical protein